MSKLYNIDELSDFTFTLSFNIIYRYKWEDPVLSEKLNSAEYQKGSFRGGRNIIKLVTYKDKIVIPQKLQKYVVKKNGTTHISFILDRIERTHLFATICTGQALEKPSRRK